jgi:hypothetical protein
MERTERQESVARSRSEARGFTRQCQISDNISFEQPGADIRIDDLQM